MSSAEQPTGPDTAVSGQPGEAGTTAVGNIIQGQVTDAAGQPVAGVMVNPQSTDTPSQPVPEIAVMTDEQGRYLWTLSPGSYTLTFTREGYATQSQAVVVQNQPAVLDVVLQPQ